MSFFEQLKLLHPGWRDVLEIAIVGYAVYRVLLVLHRTRAMQVLVGLVVLAAVFGGSLALGLGMIVYLLGEVFKYAAFALIVVFAPELRAALAQIGRSPMSRFFTHMGASEVAEEIADAACNAPLRRRDPRNLADESLSRNTNEHREAERRNPADLRQHRQRIR